VPAQINKTYPKLQQPQINKTYPKLQQPQWLFSSALQLSGPARQRTSHEAGAASLCGGAAVLPGSHARLGHAIGRGEKRGREEHAGS